MNLTELSHILIF